MQRLSVHENTILSTLVTTNQSYTSYERLFDNIENNPSEWNQPARKTLATHIHRLQKILEPTPMKITAEYGIGYGLAGTGMKVITEKKSYYL